MAKLDRRVRKIVDLMVKDSVAADGKINEEKAAEYIKVLKLLAKAESIAALSEFLKRLKSEIARTTLEIETTIPLSTQQIKQIADVVRTDYSVSEVKTTINSSLFGGLKIKIGDVVYDDSIRCKFQQLKGVIGG
jgi:F0F1-type ATP synthase delta subunit